MISVDEAERLIREHIAPLPPVSGSIDVLGEEVLAEPLVADRDIPPFSRVCMDGIALSFHAWQQGRRTFTLGGFQAAGDAPKTLDDESECIEVMTGAVLPVGCDCVVRFEEIDIQGDKVSLRSGLQLKPMCHVHGEGSDHKQGDILVEAGSYLRSSHWAVAASVGKSKLSVRRRPRLAVVSTGDELVEVGATPLSYQIRRSNPYAIGSALRSNGFVDVSTFHLPDDKATMLKVLGDILNGIDALILSGGVSMGKLDLLPEVFEELGATKIFHRVRQRPGKPFWFGISRCDKPIFALPGNPVSCVICFHRYVLPALYRQIGRDIGQRPYALLAEEVRFEPPLAYFLPVHIDYTSEGKVLAWPRPTNGSGDFASLVRSSGFIELPEGKDTYAAGTAFPVDYWSRLL